MAEHTIKDTLETTSEYMGTQIRGALSGKEDEFRVDELPTPSASIEGEIYQYMGDSTVNYQHGFFYECVALGTSPETYGWQVTNVQPTEEGQTIQVDELPTASSETEGDIYQYVGSTTANYTHGYFYECKAQGTDPETYAWEKAPTMDMPSVAIEATYDTTRTDFRFVPIMTVDLLETLTKNGRSITADDVSYCKSLFDSGRITQDEYNSIVDAMVIPTFASITDEQLSIILSSYYDGNIPLSKITSVWHVGDTRNMLVSAMAATGVGESHAEQTVTVKLVDFNHDTLATAINSKTKALITLGFELAESGYYHSSHDTQKWSNYDSSGGWQGCNRRTWCNNVCINAIPQALKESIKLVNRITDNGSGRSGKAEQVQTQDRIFIPTINEMLGRQITKAEAGNPYSSSSGIDCGTIYALYSTNKTHSKTLMTASTVSRNGSDNTEQKLQLITASGGGSNSWQDANNGIMPHFCV